MPHVVIVGAGITGLTLAWTLRRRAPADRVQVTVLERRDRAGGAIQSELVDGYLCESGPSGFLDNAPTTLALVRALGLDDRLVTSRDLARRRFVFRRGRLHPIPGSMGELFATSLLSWGGKLRIILEPLAARRPEGDESIEAFAVRRIGREAAAVLVDPMVAGIFGGDARELSLRACFPRMWELETRYGGLLRALAARRVAAAARSVAALVSPRPASGPQGEPARLGSATTSVPSGPLGAPSGRLTSFVGGMSDLVGALADRLGEAVRRQQRVVTVDAVPRPAPPGAAPPPGRRYLVDVEGYGWIEADAVALTGSAAESAAIVARLDPALAAILRRLPTASIVVVCLGYDAAALAEAGVRLDGFGFLVPRDEPPRLLGVLWESSIYPGRAPSGKVLLRAMLGGARDPWAVHLDDAALLEVVRRDLARTMRIEIDPELVRIVRHRVGLPQYTLGHLDRLAAVDERLAHHPGLFLGGHAFRGVGVNACIAEAQALADRILAYLDELVSWAPPSSDLAAAPRDLASSTRP
jgi:oxygen-dependent protoporphyrinogen oxidase